MSTEEIRVLPGTTYFRTVGANAGTDVQIWHDGVNGEIRSNLGSLIINGVIGIDNSGNITGVTSINGSAAGSVTQINTGTGLTGGPITTTGTISMATSGVTAGTYGSGTNFPQIVVDALGRITSATTVALGSIASQGSNNVTITGGTISVTADPVNSLDVATKHYVDTATSALNIHQPVAATTTANLSATYGTGSAGTDGGNGVGATLTNAGAQAAFTTDGYNGTAGDRILIKDQTTQLQNGIYTITTVGNGSTNWVLTRASDYDNHAIANDVDQGDFILVDNGGTYAHTAFLQTHANPIIVGTTAIQFTQFSGAIPVISLTGDVTGSGAGSIPTTLANTAVTAGSYGDASHYASFTVDAKGRLTQAGTFAVPATGVTNVATGTGLTGGPITSTGTVSVASHGITYALMQQTSGTSLLGGTGAGATISEISIGSGLTLSAGTLSSSGGGGSGTALTKTVAQTAHGFSVGNIVQINSGGTYVLAKADSAADAEVLGIVTSVVDANDFQLTSSGYITGLSGLSIGSTYFLSPLTAGTWTTIEPSTAGQVSKPIFIADSATSGYFFNFRGELVSAVNTLAGSTLAGNATGIAAAPSAVPLTTNLRFNNGSLDLGTSLTISGAVVGTPSNLTSGTVVTINLATASNFTLTLGTNVTLANPSNMVAGQSGNIVINQNASTPYSLAFGSNWKSTNGQTPTVSQTLGAQNLISYYVADSSHIWYSLQNNGVA